MPALPSIGQRRTCSAAETQAFGRQLAAALVPGDLVAMVGDLGSGKTCLIQGICSGLAVQDVVNSPTFVLLNVYRGRHGARPVTVYHFDLYRLTVPEELEEIGAGEFFYEDGAISLVEWADRLPQMLPPGRWEVELDHGVGADERHIRWRRLQPEPRSAQEEST